MQAGLWVFVKTNPICTLSSGIYKIERCEFVGNQWQVQRHNARVEKGSVLSGPNATGNPPELSVGEAARRRYLEVSPRKSLDSSKRLNGDDDSR